MGNQNRRMTLSIVILLSAFLFSSASAAGSDIKELDKALIEVIEQFDKIIVQDGPERISFPWDPGQHEIDVTVKPPDFTSYWTFTPKIGERPRVRDIDGAITSSIFVAWARDSRSRTGA